MEWVDSIKDDIVVKPQFNSLSLGIVYMLACPAYFQFQCCILCFYHEFSDNEIKLVLQLHETSGYCFMLLVPPCFQLWKMGR
jgi:hypothetical protein